MSWQTEMSTMIRHVINDLPPAPPALPTYSDDRLSELILVCAQQVQQEVSFQFIYSVNIDQLTLSPDPTNSTPRDEGFLWLVSLKCCSVIAMSEFKTAAANAVIIRDNDITVDMKTVLEGKKAFSKEMSEVYETARWKYTSGTRQAGAAIFGPFGVLTASYYGQAGGFAWYEPRQRPYFS